ncbi:MAG: hypothetical protein DRI71_09950 [Bacteroidetes bacterium]|nr:MAG: hypothetical protein DRI71_09950 [Bacteroidota bacterium]
MKKAPISVRIIHVLSVIVFWILVVITAASFVFNILLQTNAIGGDFQLRIALPVTFEVEEVGKAQLFDTINDVRIEEATGQLHIVNTPVRFSKIVLRILFAVVAIVLFMTWKFKMFITNIKDGLIFDASNINNLKHIAYGILILWLLTKVYMEVFYHTFVKFVEFHSVTLANDVTNENNMIVIALLLWVLAHIFMKGVEMKKEQDLTV